MSVHLLWLHTATNFNTNSAPNHITDLTTNTKSDSVTNTKPDSIAYIISHHISNSTPYIIAKSVADSISDS